MLTKGVKVAAASSNNVLVIAVPMNLSTSHYKCCHSRETVGHTDAAGNSRFHMPGNASLLEPTNLPNYSAPHCFRRNIASIVLRSA
jgi:hypothetical protein